MEGAAIYSRIDPETKQKAETILHRLGMSPTEAIRMFFSSLYLSNSLECRGKDYAIGQRDILSFVSARKAQTQPQQENSITRP
jgi:hypothetical protein